MGGVAEWLTCLIMLPEIQVHLVSCQRPLSIALVAGYPVIQSGQLKEGGYNTSQHLFYNPMLLTDKIEVL